MRKFYKHEEFFNEDTGKNWLVLVWWDSSVPKCPAYSINTCIEELTAEEAIIYNEFQSSTLLTLEEMGEQRGIDLQEQIDQGLIE